VEQQTASGEVLKSSADLTSVLQTLVENASRLSAAATGMMRKLAGPVFGLWPNVMTECAQPVELKELDRHHPVPSNAGPPRDGRDSSGAPSISMTCQADPNYLNTEAQRLGGYDDAGSPHATWEHLHRQAGAEASPLRW
jgi:hypothetical protein